MNTRPFHVFVSPLSVFVKCCFAGTWGLPSALLQGSRSIVPRQAMTAFRISGGVPVLRCRARVVNGHLV